MNLVRGLLFGLVVLGCRRPPPAAEADAGPPPSDHLAPGEIPEGREKAFALSLPRAATVSMRFPHTIHVDSGLSPEELSNFIRARVKSGKVLIGATMTTFESVIVPAEPTRQITIEIRPGPPITGPKSRMIVKDVTPTPVDPNESQDERRRKAGLTPDGKLIDPQHMQ